MAGGKGEGEGEGEGEIPNHGSVYVDESIEQSIA